MLEPLISSRTRIRLLTLFLMNPGKEFYVREVGRLTGEPYYAVHSELSNLESFGLLRKERRGNQLHFSVNQEFPLYHDLQQIILKTEGVSAVLRSHLGELPGITCIFIFGSFPAGTAGPSSDIDLFLIGSVDEDTVIRMVNAAEESLHREINYTLMTEEEYRERVRNQDPFVMNIRKEPRIMLAGNCHD